MNPFPSIVNIFKKIKPNKRPKVFLFHTIKGKGIKSFENQPMWHAKKIREKEGGPHVGPLSFTSSANLTKTEILVIQSRRMFVNYRLPY